MVVCGTGCPLPDTICRNAGEQAGGAEFLIDEGCDLAMDGFDGAVAVDDDDARGFAGGDLAVFVVDAAVEGSSSRSKRPSSWPAAAVRSLRRRARWRDLSKSARSRSVRSGLRPAAHGFVHAQNDLAAELAAAALVGLGGVGEAIAEDDVAAMKGGRDDLGDALGARRRT